MQHFFQLFRCESKFRNLKAKIGFVPMQSQKREGQIKCRRVTRRTRRCHVYLYAFFVWLRLTGAGDLLVAVLAFAFVCATMRLSHSALTWWMLALLPHALACAASNFASASEPHAMRDVCLLSSIVR